MPRLIIICTCFLYVVASKMPATAQSLPFLDDVTARGLSPFGYRLDSYRWNRKDGLPDRYLFAYLHDRNGLMWMSSKSGLFTFDGFYFRMVDAVNEKLGNAIIIRLAEDTKGNIWLVKSENGLFTIDIFDPVSQRLSPLHVFLGKKKPISIPEDGNTFLLFQIDSSIWLGTANEAYRYDGSWQTVFRPGEGSFTDWFPAEKGLWDFENQELRLIGANGKIVSRFDLRSYRVRNAWVAKDMSLWVGTSQPDRPDVDHYLIFEAQGSNIVFKQTDTPPRSDWRHDYVISATGNLSGHWIYHYLWQNSLFLGFQSAPRLFNLSRLYPFISPRNPMYFDREGGFWTTTDDGIIRLVLRPNLPFVRYLDKNLPGYSTRGIALHRGELLVNSYEGARIVNLSTGSDTGLDYPYNHLGLALLSEGHYYWTSRHRGPLLRLGSNGSMESFPFEQQPDFVFSILRTAGGQLLAGTDKGLFRLNPASGRMVSAGIKDGTVSTLFMDGKRLWAGTSQGLLQLDDAGQVLLAAWKPDAGSSFRFISHIHRDEEGLFWMATHGGGLIRWNPATGEERIFTTADGLTNDKLHAVYPDRSGYLWLPSDFGLMRFDKASGKIQTFFKQDGLADNEFNVTSHFQAPDGRLFLGGINGITSFLPDDIPQETQRSGRLRLLEAKTFNLKSGKYSQQPLPALAGESLQLHPSDAFLDLSISALQFDRSDLDCFTWKVEGVQDNWIVQTSPNIRLSNLPYGQHRLLVRYSRQGNQWLGDEIAIPIDVLRPFYLDWPFLLSLLLAIAGLAWLFTQWRTRQLVAANQHLEAEVARRTRQIEADRELIARQATELRSLDEMKSRFFANVTHEFRTPLTLILGPLDRLLKIPGQNVSVADGLRTIQRSAVRLQNLVEELLELSRMEAGKLSLQEKPLAFHPFLMRLMAAFLPYAEHRGVRLRLNYRCEPDLTLLLDERKWEKIINNLLGNSLKFTPREGSITLTVTCEKDQMLLQVEDTGQGIPPEDLPHIFERFYQGRSSLVNQQGGTGLGLALCREYARLFGGELSVNSTPGEGSQFNLSFPFKEAPQVTAPPPLPLDDIQHEELFAPLLAAPERKHTVLVVEDDKDMLQYIRSCLNQDYLLLEAENGLAALRQLEQHPVDLVLSDLMMPEMDGFQLLERVKDQYADMPFVLLTARVEAQDRLQALRLGVDDYLTKPFMEEELLARLHNLIERHEIRRKLRMELNTPVADAEAPELLEVLTFDKKWLSELEAVVNANLGDTGFSVQQMAEGMNVTVRTLQYKLRSFTGLSPGQYLTEARLLEGKRLLETRRYETVAEVCFAVGLKTPRYFARLMRERFGKLPADYR